MISGIANSEKLFFDVAATFLICIMWYGHGSTGVNSLIEMAWAIVSMLCWSNFPF
jgi:hypothetical protein